MADGRAGAGEHHADHGPGAALRSRGGATSFRAFVDELEARAERDEAGEAPVVEEGTEGVRIMTVHRAKGLEFPVVILADITCNETRAERVAIYRAGAEARGDGTRRMRAARAAGASGKKSIERDEEEAVRLLYVAATRARDLIVVPVVGDEESDGWLARLNPVVYPPQTERRAPESTHPVGCPEFGDDSVLTRPPKAPGKMKAVAPGLHRTQHGTHQVVWWDPRLLILNVEEKMGLRQDKLLQADENKLVSDRGVKLHQQWSASRTAMLAAGMTPGINIATATELALAAPADAPASAEAIAIEETRRDRGRPHGKRFGTLVHLTMLRAPFDANASDIHKIASSAAKMIGAPDEEVTAAVNAVKAALQSSLMRRAKAAPTIMRECPLILRLEDGTAVEESRTSRSRRLPMTARCGRWLISRLMSRSRGDSTNIARRSGFTCER